MGCSFGETKKGISITNAFQNNLDESEGLTYRHKPKKILVIKVINLTIDQ